MSAYTRGYDAYGNGEDNPYDPYSEDYDYFEQGRHDAVMDDFYQYDDHEEDEY